MVSSIFFVIALLTGWSIVSIQGGLKLSGIMISRQDYTYRALDACKQCHEQVYHFLNSSFEDALKRMELGSTLETPMPTYYTAGLHAETQSQVRNTLRIYQSALDDFGLSSISISYNGGKDCLVMLVIYLAAIYDNYLKSGKNISKINSVYVNNEETFREQDAFLKESVAAYGLDFVPLKSGMKEGFQEYLDKYPKIKAIIVGIRRIDPYGAHMNVRQHTDNGWPDFVRLSPVLEWNTSEIWYFLRATETSYCSLYNKGYTSLGGVNTTIPNPLLRREDGTYLPAYMLQHDNGERLGRVTDRKSVQPDRREGKL